MDNPYGWLQSAIDHLPHFRQPLIVAPAGAVPHIEGEGAAGRGIVAGINPIVAAIPGVLCNILWVVVVVSLGSRIRAGVISRKVSKSQEATLRLVSSPTTLVAERHVIASPLGESATGSSTGTGTANATTKALPSTQSDFLEEQTVRPMRNSPAAPRGTQSSAGGK